MQILEEIIGFYANFGRNYYLLCKILKKILVFMQFLSFFKVIIDFYENFE